MTYATYPTFDAVSRDGATLALLLDGDDPHEVAHEAHGGDESPDFDNCMLCVSWLNASYAAAGTGGTSYTTAELREGKPR